MQSLVGSQDQGFFANTSLCVLEPPALVGLNVEPRQAAETLLLVPSHTAQPCPGTRDCTHGSLEHLSLDRNWKLLRACLIY